MYDIDNWKDEMETYMGADDPKYKGEDAFTLLQVADLYHDFHPDPTDEIFLKERKKEYHEKIDKLHKRLKIAIATNSFDTSGVGDHEGSTIINKKSISEFFKYIGRECPAVFKTHENHISPPSYLDPTHDNYCPELALAIEICDQIYVNKVGSPTKKAPCKIEAYIDKHYKSLKSGTGQIEEAFIKRMKIICNSKKSKFEKIR